MRPAPDPDSAQFLVFALAVDAALRRGIGEQSLIGDVPPTVDAGAVRTRGEPAASSLDVTHILDVLAHDDVIGALCDFG